MDHKEELYDAILDESRTAPMGAGVLGGLADRLGWLRRPRRLAFIAAGLAIVASGLLLLDTRARPRPQRPCPRPRS